MLHLNFLSRLVSVASAIFSVRNVWLSKIVGKIQKPTAKRNKIDQASERFDVQRHPLFHVPVPFVLSIKNKHPWTYHLQFVVLMISSRLLVCGFACNVEVVVNECINKI